MDNSEQKSLLDMPLEVTEKIFDAAGWDARVKLRSTCKSIRDSCLKQDREISVLRVNWSTHNFRVDCHYKNGTVTEKNVTFSTGMVECEENGEQVGTLGPFANRCHAVAQILCDILSHPHLAIDKLDFDSKDLHWWARVNPGPFVTCSTIATMLRSLNLRLKVKELHVNSWPESTGVDFTLFLHALDENVIMKISHFKNGIMDARLDTREITESPQWKNAYDITFRSQPLDDIRGYWDVPCLSLRIDTISKETVKELLEHYARTETFSKASFFCSDRFQLTAGSFPELPRDETDQNTLFYYCAETNVTLAIRFIYSSFGIRRVLPTGA